MAKVETYNGLHNDDMLDVVAYFVKYISIKNNNKDKKSDFAAFSNCLATSPWMAQIDLEYYIEYLNFLIDKKILEYDKSNNIIYLNGRLGEYECIKIKELNNNDNSFEKVYNYILKYVKNNTHLTLKLSVFHAKSFMKFLQKKGQPLVELLDEFPNLSVQILCVGKYSGDIGKEGADDEHLNNAITNGMLDLYKLASKYRRQFKIRIVTDNIVDISLRATILMEDDAICFCHFKYWRPGYERGIYGNAYEVDPHSSLALQVNQIFDNAFERAIPSRKNFGWIIYQAKRIGKFGSLVLILFALNILIFYNPLFTDNSIKLSDVFIKFGNIFSVVVLERIINFIGKKYYEKK